MESIPPATRGGRSVETAGRTYLCRAATHGEREAWVAAIAGASQNP